ncbi:MAG: hypothetical protein JWP65_2829 [Ramlibacter sp.]|jgi:hypothetical protein|uniref:hypothetical protein n=1 Tax=Ramlibacter sp. TaxID=1917967 RepID=UPI00260B03BA|nr:hypothetical protein [Ramlibacter sp.]MDB5752408.1 hypothetical protein [Ramlibacter sp.]
MSGDRSGARPDDAVTGSWACEALPLSVRKELLERELRKLGYPRGGDRRSADAAAQHQPRDVESPERGD